jgi:hypothetical protein
MDAMEKKISFPCRQSKTDNPARSPPPYWLSYPGFHSTCRMLMKLKVCARKRSSLFNVLWQRLVESWNVRMDILYTYCMTRVSKSKPLKWDGVPAMWLRRSGVQSHFVTPNYVTPSQFRFSTRNDAKLIAPLLWVRARNDAAAGVSEGPLLADASSTALLQTLLKPKHKRRQHGNPQFGAAVSGRGSLLG